MPEQRPTRAQVEAALADILASPGLLRSPQLSGFLKYIVEATLRGDEASIKAYSIAVDVFGRPINFDPQSDPIVRVQAGRLRVALDEYYRADGARSEVRFNLPVGRYVPEFELQAPAPPTEPPPMVEPEMARPAVRLPNRTILIGLVGLVAVVALVVVGQVLSRREQALSAPDVPRIAISEFAALADPGGTPPSVAGLAVELVTDLQQFEDLRPVYLQSGAARGGGGADFQLTGIARADGNNVQVTASLKPTGSDAALWSQTVSVPAEELEVSIDDISQRFADQLGSHRGPLHAEAVRWLAEHEAISGSENAYLCGLLFTRYRDSAEVDELEYAARTRDCLSAVSAQAADSAWILSMRAALLLDDTVATQPPGRLDPEPLSEARRLHERAISLAPTSSRVWELYANFLAGTQRGSEAEAAFRSALQLNPANLDAQAGYGQLLSLRGDSGLGAELAAEAVGREVSPPFWYFAAPAINALRAGNDDRAIEAADKLVVGDAELGTVVATVAAYRSKSADVLNRYFAQLLDVTRFRRFGILPVLKQRVPDAALTYEIAKVLSDAGVTPAALAERF